MLLIKYVKYTTKANGPKADGVPSREMTNFKAWLPRIPEDRAKTVPQDPRKAIRSQIESLPTRPPGKQLRAAISHEYGNR